MNYISNSSLSFRGKLFYVSNSAEYKGVWCKLREVFKLIFSCGKHDLCITQEKCDYFLKKHEKSIFARNVNVFQSMTRDLAEINSMKEAHNRKKIGDVSEMFTEKKSTPNRYLVYSAEQYENSSMYEKFLYENIGEQEPCKRLTNMSCYARDIDEKLKYQDVDGDKKAYVKTIAAMLEEAFPAPDDFDKGMYKDCMLVHAGSAAYMNCVLISVPSICCTIIPNASFQ